MDIFVNDCLSLPLQVEKNRRDIIDIAKGIHKDKFKKENIVLASNAWTKHNSYYTQNIQVADIYEEALPIITARQNYEYNETYERNYDKLYKVVGRDDMLTLYAVSKPDIDIPVTLYYTNSVDILD